MPVLSLEGLLEAAKQNNLLPEELQKDSCSMQALADATAQALANGELSPESSTAREIINMCLNHGIEIPETTSELAM